MITTFKVRDRYVILCIFPYRLYFRDDEYVSFCVHTCHWLYVLIFRTFYFHHIHYYSYLETFFRKIWRIFLIIILWIIKFFLVCIFFFFQIHLYKFFFIATIYVLEDLPSNFWSLLVDCCRVKRSKIEIGRFPNPVCSDFYYLIH